jgi:hypothetical protein
MSSEKKAYEPHNHRIVFEIGIVQESLDNFATKSLKSYRHVQIQFKKEIGAFNYETINKSQWSINC